MTAEYEIFAASADGTLISQIDHYLKLELQFRFNEVSTWLIDLPVDQIEVFSWKRRIVVKRNGEMFFSGPLSSYDRDWSREVDSEKDKASVGGHDDMLYLASRIVWPEVTGNFAASAYDVRTGAAETVIKAYVNYNAGPGAILPRRTGITIEADLARGAIVHGRGRFYEMLPFLQGLAVSGGLPAQAGGLGFRVIGLEFQVYETEDKSAEIKFSKELGTLSAFRYRLDAPKANHILVLGGGEGTARTIYETMDAESIMRHERIETIRDRRDTSVIDELSESGLEELERKKEQVSLELTPAEVDNMHGYEDWWLGDTVMAIVDDEVITDIVRGVTVTVTRKGGETMKPVIGTQNAIGRNNPLSRLLDETSQLNRRMTNLEKI